MTHQRRKVLLRYLSHDERNYFSVIQALMCAFQRQNAFSWPLDFINQNKSTIC